MTVRPTNLEGIIAGQNHGFGMNLIWNRIYVQNPDTGDLINAGRATTFTTDVAERKPLTPAIGPLNLKQAFRADCSDVLWAGKHVCLDHASILGENPTDERSKCIQIGFQSRHGWATRSQYSSN